MQFPRKDKFNFNSQSDISSNLSPYSHHKSTTARITQSSSEKTKNENDQRQKEIRSICSSINHKECVLASHKPKPGPPHRPKPKLQATVPFPQQSMSNENNQRHAICTLAEHRREPPKEKVNLTTGGRVREEIAE